MIRSASAIWSGTLKEGKGTISTESGALKNAPYSFRSRFESEPATNPEELIAAAHAGCFAMAFSAGLTEAGFTAERIDSTARVTLEKGEGGFAVTASVLQMSAKVPGLVPETFSKLAEAAKVGCPISKLLKATITLEAKLLP